MVLMSGFPDDETSFDQLEVAFSGTHALLAVCMPGYSTSNAVDIPRWGFDFDEIVEMLRATVVANFGEKKVVVVGHDWGSYVTLLYVNRYSEFVAKYITLDVGLYSLTDQPLKDKLVDLGYKGLLATAFVLRALRLGVFGIVLVALYPWGLIGPCPHETEMPRRTTAWFAKPDIGLCYPYFQLFKGVFFRTLPVPKFPKMPVLFVYGKRKRIMFHSAAFLRAIEKTENGSAYEALDCGHFMQAQMPDQVARLMKAFLE